VKQELYLLYCNDVKLDITFTAEYRLKGFREQNSGEDKTYIYTGEINKRIH